MEAIVYKDGELVSKIVESGKAFEEFMHDITWDKGHKRGERAFSFSDMEQVWIAGIEWYRNEVE